MDETSANTNLLQQCGLSPLWIFLCMDRLAGVEKVFSHILHAVSSLVFFIGGDNSSLFSRLAGGVISLALWASGIFNGSCSGGGMMGNCNVWLITGLWRGVLAWDTDSGGNWGSWASDSVGDVGVIRSGVGGALKYNT